jgi:hypothetical protein
MLTHSLARDSFSPEDGGSYRTYTAPYPRRLHSLQLEMYKQKRAKTNFLETDRA